jgi:hypothetical protein
VDGRGVHGFEIDHHQGLDDDKPDHQVLLVLETEIENEQGDEDLKAEHDEPDRFARYGRSHLGPFVERGDKQIHRSHTDGQCGQFHDQDAFNLFSDNKHEACSDQGKQNEKQEKLHDLHQIPSFSEYTNFSLLIILNCSRFVIS